MPGPYPAISSQTAVVQTIEHLRKSFPKKLDAPTLRSLEIAPKNESFILNILRFLKIIDEAGNPVESNKNIFFADKSAFHSGLANLIASAYDVLFELHGEESWALPEERLQAFFRAQDSATELVGKRKAKTFATLASIAGKREELPSTTTVVARAPRPAAPAAKKAGASPPKKTASPRSGGDGLSSIDMAVKIEINLPATTDQEVYRAIFRSLREDLLNG